MTDRDRLIELYENSLPKSIEVWQRKYTEEAVDYLLANGVIVPPCKVGDIVYTIFEGDIEALKITHTKTEESADFVYRYYDAKNKFLGMPFSDRSIVKTVFLTKEEAEEKLKEHKENV